MGVTMAGPERSSEELLANGPPASVSNSVAGSDLQHATHANELNAPEYATDEFRMHCFKVVRCSKRYVHDWRTCPFSHPTENARRRDPREHRYLAIPCPEYKKGICLLGDGCPYAHGVYECWLHPCKYRTQLCKDGEGCRRPVCFFAHSASDMRQAVTDYNPTPEDLERCERIRSQQQPAPLQQPSVVAVPSTPQVSVPLGALASALERGGAAPDATSAAALALQHASVQQLPPAFVASLSSSPNRAGSSRPSLDCFPGACGGGGMPVDVPPSLQAAAVVGSPTGCSSPTSSRSSADATGAAFDPQGAAAGPRMSNALARKLGLAPCRDGKSRGSADRRRSASLDQSPEQAYLASQRAAAAAAATSGLAAGAISGGMNSLPNMPAAAASPAQLAQLAQLMNNVPQDVYPQYALPQPASGGPGSQQQMQALMSLVASLKSLNVNNGGGAPLPAHQQQQLQQQQHYQQQHADLPPTGRHHHPLHHRMAAGLGGPDPLAGMFGGGGGSHFSVPGLEEYAAAGSQGAAAAMGMPSAGHGMGAYHLPGDLQAYLATEQASYY